MPERIDVVTGAASGLGYAIAERLVDAGSEVVGIDVDAQGLERASSGLGSAFTAVTADVRDEDAIQAAFDAVDAGEVPLRGLVNAAGIGAELGDVTQTEPEDWARTLDINLTGAYIVSRAAIPSMRAAGGGSIVHIASQLGLVGARGNPAYGASKAGLIGLGRSMALDHAAEAIRVNCVCPGPVDTPMFRAGTGPSNIEWLETEKIPLGRIGRPPEIAPLVEFLLSDDAAYLTGAAIPIDGGWTAS